MTTRADTVVVREISGGALLRLRVKPGARRDRLIGAYGECLKLEVRAVPERGQANAAVSRLLARTFSVGRSEVVVVAGRGSQDKVIEIRGATTLSIVDALQRAGIIAVVA